LQRDSIRPSYEVFSVAYNWDRDKILAGYRFDPIGVRTGKSKTPDDPEYSPTTISGIAIGNVYGVLFVDNLDKMEENAKENVSASITPLSPIVESVPITFMPAFWKTGQPVSFRFYFHKRDSTI
jgi:hypothetical protein